MKASKSPKTQDLDITLMREVRAGDHVIAWIYRDNINNEVFSVYNVED